jgi:hypothetical protein
MTPIPFPPYGVFRAAARGASTLCTFCTFWVPE